MQGDLAAVLLAQMRRLDRRDHRAATLPACRLATRSTSACGTVPATPKMWPSRCQSTPLPEPGAVAQHHALGAADRRLLPGDLVDGHGHRQRRPPVADGAKLTDGPAGRPGRPSKKSRSSSSVTFPSTPAVIWSAWPTISELARPFPGSYWRIAAVGRLTTSVAPSNFGADLHLGMAELIEVAARPGGLEREAVLAALEDADAGRDPQLGRQGGGVDLLEREASTLARLGDRAEDHLAIARAPAAARGVAHLAELVQARERVSGLVRIDRDDGEALAAELRQETRRRDLPGRRRQDSPECERGRDAPDRRQPADRR